MTIETATDITELDLAPLSAPPAGHPNAGGRRHVAAASRRLTTQGRTR